MADYEPEAEQRCIVLKYIREDGNYSGWNLWVWNTGQKDGQVDFTELKDGAAVARIYISDTAPGRFHYPKGQLGAERL